MDIAVQDRVRVRKMRHAVRMTADLRDADAVAALCLGEKLATAATALLEAAVAGYRPDDEGTAAVKAAEQGLRDTLVACAKALRRAGVAAGDEAADAMDALVDGAFPKGRAEDVPPGPPLQAAADRFVAALRDVQPSLADTIAAVAAQYGEALEAASASVDEIDPAVHKLIKARAEADRWIRACRAFVTYKTEAEPSCGVAYEDVWPVSDTGSWDAQNFALDDVGVPEPEDEEAQDEPPFDDEEENDSGGG